MNDFDQSRIAGNKWAAIYAAAHGQAKSNPNEVLYAVDRDTGAVAYHEEGEPEHVEVPLEVLEKHHNLFVVHTHPDGTPPSSDDFGHLIDNESIRQITVVTKRHRYTLDKPVGWNHEKTMGFNRTKFPDGSSIAALVHNNITRRQRKRIETTFDPVPLARINEAIHMANEDAAKQYKLRYLREDI